MLQKLVPVVVFGSLLVGCSGTVVRCTTLEDCLSNEICVMGQCRAVVGGTGGASGSTGGGAGATGGNGGSSGGGLGNPGGGSGGLGGGGGGGSLPDAGLIEPDAGVFPPYDGGCGVPDAGNPSIRRLCAPAAQSECNGTVDSALSSGGVPSSRLNGTSGNGFDDDCDGEVDEGCFCPSNGLTKECYLVPATQVDSSGAAVGWCASNAKGSLDCIGGEFTVWSGVCRGAQPPQLVDECGPGDFNCDGLAGNNARAGCQCPNDVSCPTTAITARPYPTPTNIPVLDGRLWIADAAARTRATNWTWTVVGGDCDNVLPNPTFALYSSANSLTSPRLGSRTALRLDTTQTPPRYVSAATSPLIGLRATGASGAVYPAFGLSGDYIVQGEFTLDGKSYSCTQKVEVRAPGIRAELCWDSVGTNDIDLHFARLQGTTCSTKGFMTTCVTGGVFQDCYYRNETGCVSASSNGPRWGYANSANDACLGWSSRRSSTGTQLCTNPRLDRDNVACDRSKTDPTDSSFCGPENINLDTPNNGDAFVVGVNHYAQVAAGSSRARPHVNLYCNGQRVISVGFNPATGSQFPLLDTPGEDDDGDFWKVATIKANVTGGALTSCDVTTIPSRVANTTRDGPAASGRSGNDLCVDHNYANHNFVELSAQGAAIGSQPTMASQWCKH